jgi:hypothetical protein
MKQIVLSLLLALSIQFSFGHDIHEKALPLHHWKTKTGKVVEGSFSMMKNEVVYIEDDHHQLQQIPFAQLSFNDQLEVHEKVNRINVLNALHESTATPSGFSKSDFMNIMLMISLLAFVIIFSVKLKKQVMRWSLPFFTFIILFSFFGFTNKSLQLLQSTTSISFLDSAFAPFVPNVHTFYDTTYYYVESKGIPATHKMMVGISNHGWQQQVPIPQCYLGTNAWPIPLHPSMATSPIPVDSIHFTRGAIALAVNGIPIFNVHTNTGVDSYLDGQLDNFGGHCGRADDYHYHTAPLHLAAYTQSNMPIAIGLDGYAVYGSTEPDGSALQTLDANHGHFGSNGVYHYHGSASAPYMIARMAGNVTEDNTHQLIPQAAAHPVRPSLTPLSGALITNCTANGANNGYNLTYTRNGQTDSVVYSWTNTGQYTFKYYTNGNLDSTVNRNGFVQCTVPLTNTGVSELNQAFTFSVFPNPVTETLNLSLPTKYQTDEASIYNLQGREMLHLQHPSTSINIKSLAPGVYFLKLVNEKKQILQTKFVVQ